MALSYKVVDIADNSTAVTAEACKLHGIYVNTVLSAHACPIEDAGGSTIFTLVASLAAGSKVEFNGVQMGGITINPNDAATGNITVIYELI